jgi:hypothetical protein
VVHPLQFLGQVTKSALVPRLHLKEIRIHRTQIASVIGLTGCILACAIVIGFVNPLCAKGSPYGSTIYVTATARGKVKESAKGSSVSATGKTWTSSVPSHPIGVRNTRLWRFSKAILLLARIHPQKYSFYTQLMQARIHILTAILTTDMGTLTHTVIHMAIVIQISLSLRTHRDLV